MSVINIFTKFSKMITFTRTTNTWTITAQYIKYFTYTKTVIHVCYQHCYQALQNYHLYMYNQHMNNYSTAQYIKYFTCTKTVKKMMTIVAVMKSFLSGMRSSFSESARQNAIPPRRPPNAITNWSMIVSLTRRL